jgi:hypothetical protein
MVLLPPRSAFLIYSPFPPPLSFLCFHHTSQLKSSNALLPFSSSSIPPGSTSPPPRSPLRSNPPLPHRHIARTDATHTHHPSLTR